MNANNKDAPTNSTVSRCDARTALMALMVMAQPVGAWAVEVGVSADLGAGHTNNIEHSDRNSSTTFGVARLASTITANTRTLSADVEASVIRYELSDSAYESFERFAARADVDWSPIPDRFSWNFSANAGQVAVDPTDSISYRASGNAKVFSTGPVFEQPLPGNNALVARGSITRSDFGYGYSLESTTKKSELEFRHDFSKLRSYSMGVRYRDSTEELGNQEGSFYVSTAYLAFRSIARRSAIDLELSGERLRAAGETSRTAGYAATLEHAVGSRTRIFASTARGWRDSADLFSSTIDQVAEVDGIRFVPISGELFRYRQVRAGILREGSFVDLNLVVARSAEQARVRKDAVFTATFPLAARNDLRLAFYGSRQREQNNPAPGYADDWSASARYTWQVGKRLSVIGTAAYISGELDSADFSETRYALTLRYGFSETTESRSVGFDRKYERSLDEIRGGAAERD